jgi:hypothetical protein
MSKASVSERGSCSLGFLALSLCPFITSCSLYKSRSESKLESEFDRLSNSPIVDILLNSVKVGASIPLIYSKPALRATLK